MTAVHTVKASRLVETRIHYSRLSHTEIQISKQRVGGQISDSRGVFILQEAKLISLTIRTQRLHDGNYARRGERGRAVEGWIKPGKQTTRMEG